MKFRTREEAGRLLAQQLKKKGYNGDNSIVYALPRGGVVTALQVARVLDTPLDLCIVRKIGHPGNKEYAVGAISQHGHIAKGPEFAEIDSAWLKNKVTEEENEIARRKTVYLSNRKEKNPVGKIAFIVDDGIATGLTMQAAIDDIASMNPEKIVVAVPVLPRETYEDLRKKVSDVVYLDAPEDFLGAIGNYYDEFPQLEDGEVVDLLKNARDPLVFYFPSALSLAHVLMKQNKNMHEGKFTISTFPNKELLVTLISQVRKKDCIVVLQSFSEQDIVALLLLSDTLQKEGAASITCVLPYFPYNRQDANEKGRSQGFFWLGDMLRSCGVSEVVTVDIHNPTLLDYFPTSLSSLSLSSLFAKEITKQGLQDATLVAPDEGAKSRCQEVATALGKKGNITYCRKRREKNTVTSVLEGSVGADVIIIDDMIDTGKTLLACFQQLQKYNVSRITLFVTHAFFSGSLWKKLWQFPLQHLYCTDTVPFSVSDKRMSVVSVHGLISDFLKEKYV